MTAALRNFTGRNADFFKVFAQRLYIGAGAMSGGGPGGPTTWWRGPGWPTPPYRVAALWPPLRLCFGLCLVSGENRNFGLRFIQFREYFLCNFSETQKQQKTGNWHCGISSIG
jgi:hypothetical protein